MENQISSNVEALKSKGWQVSDIAESIGVGRVSLFRWITGRNECPTEKAVIIALGTLASVEPPKRTRRKKEVANELETVPL